MIPSEGYVKDKIVNFHIDIWVTYLSKQGRCITDVAKDYIAKVR